MSAAQSQPGSACENPCARADFALDQTLCHPNRWGILLPFRLLTLAFVIVVGWTFDRIDRTNAFYRNVPELARKRAPARLGKE